MRRGLAVILMSAVVVALASPARADDRAAEKADPSAEALALVAQGQMRLAVGAIAEGLKLFRRAVALDPDSHALAEEFGLALADAGINDEAVKQLDRAGELTPTGEATLGMLLAQAAQTPQELEAALPHLERGVGAVPNGGQARLVLAQSLLRLGKGPEAWEQVKVLLDDRPDDPRIWLMAGETLRLTGKFDEAAGYLERAAAVPDLNQQATLQLVDTLASARKYKEAAELLGNLLKKDGGTLAGMTRWATLLARAGDRAHAREVLDKVLAGDPNQRDAILLKAILEAGDGHLDVAEGLYRRAHAAHPDDPDAAMGLARLLVDMRRLPEARTLLNSVWQQIEEKKIDNPDATVEVAQERAALELLDHRPDAALPWLEKCGPGPLARRTLALWGEYYRLREAWSDGLAFLRGAKVEDGPDAVRLKSAIFAEFSLAAGDAAAAAPVLDKLLAGDADDVVAALGVLDRAKRFADAAAKARVAMARLGDAPEVQFAYAAALERSGAWDDAVAEFKKLLAKQPDNAAALNYLGYMFADKGVHLDEARGMLIKAVQLDPSSGAFQDSLGWVYFRLGDLDRAEKYLTEAGRLDPFDASVKEHVGDLLRARGDMTRAAEAYRQALANHPEEAGQKDRIEKKLAEVAGAKTP
ncbi:MAG: tetratricopeptide repeat protein [Thermoanaerobaculaceae bacterium]|nr:tetratricopeptide repeat protein [Thermoanaerobaculaceae bacterium]